jgi:hypothetical protein
MQLSQVEWRALVDTVRLGPNQFRVIRPAHPCPNGLLYDTGSSWLDLNMEVDAEAAVDLAMAWGLTTRSPHSLVYLPLRPRRVPTDPHPHGTEAPLRPLDLVLLHHSLGFPPARWKQVRARLGLGTPMTVTLPPSTFDERPLHEHHRTWHRTYRDHLRCHLAADTLFVAGSHQAFALQAHEIRGLVEDAPAHVASHVRSHYCATIDMGSRVRTHGAPPREIHIEYRPG